MPLSIGEIVSRTGLQKLRNGGMQNSRIAVCLQTQSADYFSHICRQLIQLTKIVCKYLMFPELKVSAFRGFCKMGKEAPVLTHKEYRVQCEDNN